MKKANKPVDHIDSKIIKLLQKDGRLSNTDIAKEINLSEGTVRTRLNRLIKNRIIQIVAVSNPIKLGFKIVGHLRIHVEPSKIEDVIAHLKQIKALWYIVLTAGGGTGIDAEFTVKSLDELNDLIYNNLGHIDGITNVETTLTLDFIKRKYDWGTALEEK
ncbi:MAG: Lrp/AsnC family transcriptional regulator [Desulfobacteraceae bacterium]|nr:Lrp/AsnC family transcriptional regulator [Desulfobacteraceae bacterium]